MKKRILILLLILLSFSTTACVKSNKNNPNKKSITITDKDNNYKTTFYYDKKEKYTKPVINYSEQNNEVTFTNKDLNIEFQMYYNVFPNDSYKAAKEARKDQKYYQDYKFGKYKGYTYGNLDDVIYLNIYLDKKKEYGEIILFTTIKKADSSQKETIKELFDNEKIQSMLKTITFEIEKNKK